MVRARMLPVMVLLLAVPSIAFGQDVGLTNLLEGKFQSAQLVRDSASQLAQKWQDRYHEACNLCSSGRYVEAEPVLSYLVGSTPWLTDATEQKIHCWTLLARAHESQGRQQQADQDLRRAIALAGNEGGNRSTDILWTRAEINLRRHRRQEAEADFRALISLYEQSYGASSPEVADVVLRLAETKLAAGELPFAVPLLQRVLAIRQTTLPTGHPRTVDLLLRLAETCLRMGQAKSAEPLARQALDAMGSWRPDDPLIGRARLALVEAEVMQNRADEADRLLEQLTTGVANKPGVIVPRWLRRGLPIIAELVCAAPLPGPARRLARRSSASAWFTLDDRHSTRLRLRRLAEQRLREGDSVHYEILMICQMLYTLNQGEKEALNACRTSAALGRHRLANGRFAAAESILGTGMDLRGAFVWPKTVEAEGMYLFATAKLLRGATEAAQKLIRDADGLIADSRYIGDPFLIESLERCVRALHSFHRDEAAAALSVRLQRVKQARENEPPLAPLIRHLYVAIINNKLYISVGNF